MCNKYKTSDKKSYGHKSAYSSVYDNYEELYETNKSDTISIIIQIITILTVLYIAISSFVYSIKNPELTQMQVFLNIKNALLWK